MRKFAGLFIMVGLFCLPALAQDSSKYEVGGGFAYRSFDNYQRFAAQYGWMDCLRRPPYLEVY